MITPCEIDVLLHYHVTVNCTHPRYTTLAVENATQMLVENDLLELNSARTTYTTTLKGQFLVGMLCSTPFPVQVQKYVDPRFGGMA